MSKSRVGLYFMVFVAMLASCNADHNVAQLDKHLKQVADKLGVTIAD